MRRIQIIVIFIFVTFLSSGCASILENVPGYTHTAALIIGESEKNILSQAEHILGEPKIVAYTFQGTEDEIEVRRYTFTNIYDIVLYFHKNIFFQAGLIEPESTIYPAYREDYKEVYKGSPGPIGYMLVRNGKTISIDTLYEQNVEDNSITSFFRIGS